MNVLGLHFGHDAGVCVMRDGQVAAFVSRERYSRTKHAISLQFQNIAHAVQAAGLRFDQIDCCAITSTQNMELIIDDPANFNISLERYPNDPVPSGLGEHLRQNRIDPATLANNLLLDLFQDPQKKDFYLYQSYGHAFPEHRTRPPADFARFPWVDQQLNSPLWANLTLQQIGVTDISPVLADDSFRLGLHLPVTVRLLDRTIPGYYVPHHAAHAASNYYQSKFDRAAILSHDGGGQGANYLSGMYFWAVGNRLYPLMPHYLMIGSLYEFVGVQLGLGYIGPPGKLMGLAAYGQPRFFDRAFVGNAFDLAQRNVASIPEWSKHCLALAQGMGYDQAPLGKGQQATAAINIDIAASTQKLFEEIYLLAVEALHNLLRRSRLSTNNLCLTGGCALNCPSNGRVFREGRFRNLYIEPGCDDSGLPVGAAAFVYHNLFDRPLPARSADGYATPYLGVDIPSADIDAVVTAAGDRFHCEPCSDPAAAAAADLAADRVIGWFEGRSEIGPRALGHRSILADPRKAENWPRVNAIKGREAWRPFAPAVLAEHASQWFIGLPTPSPYMLFTAMVRSHQLPAITHVDGSARVQTVDVSCGKFFDVLRHFYELTGVPVVLNTSFNGPGEPIVESPEQALNFLNDAGLDALYMGRYRISRHNAR